MDFLSDEQFDIQYKNGDSWNPFTNWLKNIFMAPVPKEEENPIDVGMRRTHDLLKQRDIGTNPVNPHSLLGFGPDKFIFKSKGQNSMDLWEHLTREKIEKQKKADERMRARVKNPDPDVWKQKT